MFDWLFEGRIVVYALLGVAAATLAALWMRDRRRPWLLGLLALALLAGGYVLLDRLVETRQEQVSRKLQEMAAAVAARNAEAIFRHISDRFRFQGMNKAQFRSYVESALRQGGVSELIIWNVQRLDETGQVAFNAKPRGYLTGTDAPYLVRARFVEESGGQWRLESFQIYNPYVNTTQPLEIPALPR
ncbi:MAG: hypothetical protein U0840_29745 [Gemmataceae bacterium]